MSTLTADPPTASHAATPPAAAQVQPTFAGVVRGEWIKLLSLRSTWWALTSTAAVITLVALAAAASSAAGGRHEALAGHEGKIAIDAWAGNPKDPESQTSGTGWILATEWVPYQLPTFVTPSFAGYVSGHSTFSRAAAEVLTAMTGSEYFPGGLHEWTIRSGDLDVEAGPTEDVILQAATYYDEADQAGRSRIYGGIHISADDFAGRRIGSLCGTAAWDEAVRYFEGSIRGTG